MNPFKKCGLGMWVTIVTIVTSFHLNAQNVAIIQIQANEVISKVNPLFYGLMTEEINYSYDGGLYAELIRNRTFNYPAPPPPRAPRAPRTAAPDGTIVAGTTPQATPPAAPVPAATPATPPGNGLYHWSLIADQASKANIALDSIPQPNTALTRNLRLDIETVGSKSRVGIANEGFWGIPVMPNTQYRASFYAKSGNGFKGVLTVAIESNDGQTTFATAQVKSITGQWGKYSVVLTTGDVAPSSTNKFSITASSKGTVWFSLVSLFPPTWNNRPNGNRTDIMQLMQEMKPTFLRFPGGNYLQGNTLATRFDWKKTLGDLTQRPTHYNDAWRYQSSDGMGLLEFLYWCEDLNMEPILGVFAGFNLGSRNPLVGEALEPYIEDALNEIEYITGDVKTKWGAVRAKDGHPEPFKMTYVEVGNEDFFDRTAKTYDQRFTQFFKAIKEKYPDLQVIASDSVQSVRPDLLDIHQYMRTNVGLREAHRYDNYDRNKPKVFIGEYATREGSPTTNHRAGLYDAAYLAGLERNADMIQMTCYAPIFVNVNPGAMQWPSDLMGYDALTSFGSPSYYVQKMFSNNLGDELVKSSITGVPVTAATGYEEIYYSVTSNSKTKDLFLKVVNVSDLAHTVKIDISGVTSVAFQGEVTVLKSDKPEDTNTITDPTRIVPSTSRATGFSKTFSYSFAPYSVTVLKLTCK